MTDWKGNEIKIGDTIVLIDIHPEDEISKYFRTGLITPPDKQVSSSERPLVWRKLWEKEVVDLAGAAYVQYKSGEQTYWQQLLMLEITKENWHIACIKGISDNEQDYYTEYFKAK